MDQSEFAEALPCLQGRDLFINRVIVCNIDFAFCVPQVLDFDLMLRYLVFQLLGDIRQLIGPLFDVVDQVKTVRLLSRT